MARSTQAACEDGEWQRRRQPVFFVCHLIQNKVHRMRIGGGGGGGGKGGALTAAARVALNSSLSTHTCEFKFKLGGAVA